jgi:hypothetical protein
MKPSKLIEDLIYLAIVALAGVALYKIWQVVSPLLTKIGNAASSIGNTAISYNPSNIVNGVANDLTGLGNSIVSGTSDGAGLGDTLFSGGGSVSDTTDLPYYNQLAQPLPFSVSDTSSLPADDSQN